MSRLLLAILIFILGFWLIGGSWWYAQKYGMPITEGIAYPSALPALQLNDGTFNITKPSNFHFRRSSDQVVIPWETEKALKELVTHLTDHPERRLVLTGRFDAMESNRSDMYDLGFARASAIKDVLLKYGANPDGIILQSYEGDNLYFRKSLLFNAVSFDFEGNSADLATANSKDVSTKTIENRTNTVRPLNLYYENNERIVMSSAPLQDYLLILTRYMQEHPRSQLLITGHTDNTGGREANKILAQKRADSVKALIETHGIPKQKIKVDFQGDTQPLASNHTAEGRKKNRRVEVRILD